MKGTDVSYNKEARRRGYGGSIVRDGSDDGSWPERSTVVVINAVVAWSGMRSGIGMGMDLLKGRNGMITDV